MKLHSILLLFVIACIVIGNSSFSCISLQKLSVDSIYTVQSDAYGIAPLIDIEDFNIDSLQIQLASNNYLFRKQLLQKKLQLVAKANDNRIYTIENFKIVSVTRDSIQTNFVYYSYNPKHLGPLAGKEFMKKDFKIPVIFIDSFTSYAPYKRKKVSD